MRTAGARFWRVLANRSGCPTRSAGCHSLPVQLLLQLQGIGLIAHAFGTWRAWCRATTATASHTCSAICCPAKCPSMATRMSMACLRMALDWFQVQLLLQRPGQRLITGCAWYVHDERLACLLHWPQGFMLRRRPAM